MRGFIAALMAVGLMTACGGVESETTEPDLQADDSGGASAQVIYCTSCNVGHNRCLDGANGDPVKVAECDEIWVDCLSICS